MLFLKKIFWRTFKMISMIVVLLFTPTSQCFSVSTSSPIFVVIFLGDSLYDWGKVLSHLLICILLMTRSVKKNFWKFLLVICSSLFHKPMCQWAVLFIVEMSVLPEVIYGFKKVPRKTPNTFVLLWFSVATVNAMPKKQLGKRRFI